jgi:hypothetical protein
MPAHLHAKYPLLLSDFDMLNFLVNRLSKNLPKSNLMKIRPMGTELFHGDEWTEGQTDMAQRIVAFRNFANTPNWVKYLHCVINRSLIVRKSTVVTKLKNYLPKVFVKLYNSLS